MAAGNPKVLTSPLAPYIEGLVATKRACGFSYDSEEAELGRFDRFCSERGVTEARIDRDTVMAWAEPHGSEGATHRAQRISFVRQLSLYMVSCGIDCYVPRHFTPSSKRVVYVPGKDEVRQLLSAADSYASSATACRSWVRIGYPVEFRLMYCCGLRISECACLLRADVDIDAGTLTIRHSKGDKDRVVYLADDSAAMCEGYWESVVRAAGASPAWFFPGEDIRNHITASGIRKKFQQLWAQTDASGLSSRRPSPHSLRHAFVVNRINSWAEDGVDLDEMMPYLSRYLGHAGPTETFYYYHQTLDAMAVIRERDSVLARVAPDVVSHGR
jgi:site-specific recombinase XerD